MNLYKACRWLRGFRGVITFKQDVFEIDGPRASALPRASFVTSQLRPDGCEPDISAVREIIDDAQRTPRVCRGG